MIAYRRFVIRFKFPPFLLLRGENKVPEEEGGFREFKQPSFTKASDFMWDISPKFKAGMRVPSRIVASKALLDAMDLMVYDQITNVATLPGIQKFAFCMPDGHIAPR
jgi:hypothetical protein